MGLKIVVTGTPGVGKSSVARELAKLLKARLVNEREFCKKHKIGIVEKGELIVPLQELERELERELQKLGNKKNVVLEGHLLCELRLPVDFAIVLCLNDFHLLEKRLEARGYAAVKVLDNVYCEAVGYCRKKALKNYGKKRLVLVENSKAIKEIAHCLLRKVKEKQGMLKKKKRKKS